MLHGRHDRKIEEGGRNDAVLQLAQAGLHVATEGDDLQVGPPRQQEGFTTQRRSADDGALG